MNEVVHDTVQEIVPGKLEEQILQVTLDVYVEGTKCKLTRSVEITLLSRKRSFNLSPSTIVGGPA